jgi:hypothetical protein
MTVLKDRDELRRKLRLLGEVSVSDKGASTVFPAEYYELKPVFGLLFSSLEARCRSCRRFPINTAHV